MTDYPRRTYTPEERIEHLEDVIVKMRLKRTRMRQQLRRLQELRRSFVCSQRQRADMLQYKLREEKKKNTALKAELENVRPVEEKKIEAALRALKILEDAVIEKEHVIG